MSASTILFIAAVMIHGAGSESGQSTRTPQNLHSASSSSSSSSSFVMTRKPVQLPIGSPGDEIQKSRVTIPSQVMRGEALKGKAPPESWIEAFGKRMKADSDGYFQLLAPSSSGIYPIKLHRPTRNTPLLLHVEVMP